MQGRQSNLGGGFMGHTQVSVAPATPGVSNCYVFKSQLQEYAQKVGLSTPSYETIREGPSHEPYFRSTVIIGGESYESLPGFTNRKAAEQSAAEVALMELSKYGDRKESIAVPVHQTGLCKNLLQEYAQKMNYAVPTYVCRMDDTREKTAVFSCTVDIGGIQYIGAAAKTKKEAELKAARTALLAIQSSGSMGGELCRKTQCTVLPCKRKVSEPAPAQAVAKNAKKSKKRRIKKKPNNRMHPGFVDSSMSLAGNMPGLACKIGTAVSDQDGVSDVQVPVSAQIPYCLENLPPVEKLTNKNESDGCSVGEVCGRPQVISNVDGSRFRLSGDVNINSADPTVISANANSSDDLGLKAPSSVQLDTSLRDFSINHIPIVTYAEQYGNTHGPVDISSTPLDILCTGSGDAVQQETTDTAELHEKDGSRLTVSCRLSGDVSINTANPTVISANVNSSDDLEIKAPSLIQLDASLPDFSINHIPIVTCTEQDGNTCGSVDISCSPLDILCTGSGFAVQQETTDAAEVHGKDDISSNPLDAVCTDYRVAVRQGAADEAEVHGHEGISSDVLGTLFSGSRVALQQGTTDAAEVYRHDEIPSDPLNAACTCSGAALQHGTTNVAEVHLHDDISSNPLDDLHTNSGVALQQGTTDVTEAHPHEGQERNG